MSRLDVSVLMNTVSIFEFDLTCIKTMLLMQEARLLWRIFLEQQHRRLDLEASLSMS